jgi:tetratricopeptide (TPR) repeat protein
VEPTDESRPGPSTPHTRMAAELMRAVLRAEQRLRRNLDRAALARRLNVSPASLYAYLNGTTLPRSAVFERLLDELGVSGAERGRLGTLRDEAEMSRRVGPGHEPPHPGAPGPSVRPGQLPPCLQHFVGREAELARLTGLADAAQAAWTVGICVIHGTAGVGKTTLATTWAHRFKTGFPDGQLHADLRGFDGGPPADPGEALLGFLHALGTSLSEIPPTTDARMTLFRSLLSKRRMLIVLDNGRSTEQVRPLIPAAPGCLVIVTSRDRMDSLVAREGAERISLDVMPHADAEDLLAERLGAERLAAEPESAQKLVDLCASLPLALSLVAARMVDRPDEPLSALVTELQATYDRLDVLASSDADLDIQTVFQWSYDVLSAESARLFRLLGLHPGPDADITTCAALMGTAALPRKALRELVRANLLRERPIGRFSSHDLLRAYARARGRRDDPEMDRANAMRRLLDHHLWAATRANATIQPNEVGEWGRADDVPTGRTPKLDTYAQAMAWFAAEHAALRSLIDYAATHGFESHAWRLAWTCMVFLRRTGQHLSRVKVQRAAVHAARRAADPRAEATSLRLLADALARARQGGEVLLLLDEALSIFRALDNDDGRLRTHLSFVRALDAAGDHLRALDHAGRALGLAEAGESRLMLADALAATGRQLTRLARPTDALVVCERASAIYLAEGHTEGMASLLKVVGDAELDAERVQRAIATYQRSLELDRMLGDSYWEAHALSRLATAHERSGDKRTSVRLRGEALAMLDALHHPDASVLRTRPATP